ncbi:ABC transporter substrate-binding protein [Rhodococcus phenolicus]|uniref:ABC transporter substrate-binding protein n=1 Tax=Rhodococcus phenolicus TaxID=263849 RepID=UPI0008340D66|nr:ABC transporter substrate-binding protein [Rhodococcus phenolicus]
MKIRPRLMAAAGLGTAVTLFLSACGGEPASSGASGGDPVRGGTLVYSYNTEAQSVDPATCAIGIGVAPCQAVYGALLYYDTETGEIQPGMAESFTTEDGKVWTLKLRPGLTFTDGTPFDAAAVAFNWDRILDPALLSPSASVAGNIAWEVVDPATLRITSDEVNYRLDFGLTEALAYIASPTAIREKGADFGNNPVGAGPFTLTSWARGTEMTLDRNPTYWDQPRPYVDRLVIRTIPADDQRFNALQAGEVDVMAVTVHKYADRAESAGMNVTRAALLGGTGVRLSHRGALADPGVRTAIAKLTDNQQIMNAVYPGESAASGFTPEDSPLYDPGSAWPEPDVEGAQRLIDEYRARTGSGDIELTYVLTAGSPVLNQTAELIQAQLQRVDGLRVRITPLEGGAFAAAMTSGDYDLIVSGLGGAHPDNLYKVFRTGGSSNNSGYSNPKVDEALDLTHTSSDPETVANAYKTAVNELVATNAYRFWRHARTDLISPANVHGIEVAYQYWFRPELAWVQQ